MVMNLVQMVGIEKKSKVIREVVYDGVEGVLYKVIIEIQGQDYKREGFRMEKEIVLKSRKGVRVGSVCQIECFILIDIFGLKKNKNKKR